MAGHVELALDAQAVLGEGPLWDEREKCLYWVDIVSQALHVYNPASGENKTSHVGQMVSTVVLSETGSVLLAVQNGLAWFDLVSGKLDIIVDPESDKPGNRFNDGKCDPGGRFWAGTMDVSASLPRKGSLYRLDPDMSVHTMLTDISISNGIVWTADHKTMYFNDSIPGTVTAFDFDNATGDISNPRIVIQVPENMGMPDGMAIDSEGMLWIAHFYGGAVHRWNPDTGKVLETIKLPASNPTACAFAGDNLDELYITTARDSLSAEQLKQEPHSGGLFHVKTGVVGTVTHRFKGQQASRS
ncbi:SMP-30/gluconolactonase/LRE family protein [Aggregatilinea lenta]|uniref:SMP-30/gluconolactonase/LRE family protein n=1 Tax=Aggregatilinea lenta TaxID=913108 RepID=UPI000E5BCE81|nr:SMP-30/gluconolactonase/LRE family protein [Aggregatilinea lenta]